MLQPLEIGKLRSRLKSRLQLLLYIISAALFTACSAERSNVLSKTYHNITARYNAYFYAKQRIQEIERIVNNNYENDYNKILRIYPEVDSVLAKSYETESEDALKKASIAIQRHQNSKWVDDSYILIGRTRFYTLEYGNAVETYKYVNTQSDDDNARHEALVRLHRTFTDAGDYNNAIAVHDYLKKEKLNKRNRKLLHLNLAHYYQIQNDLDNMVQNLVEAAPLLKRKDGKGRIYFIIGQTYQSLGFDAEAFNYYKKCIASNPVYELDFYARLSMAQVTELDKDSDVRSARRLFKKLLTDKKNKEFRDKIYYEMAEFELKNSNLDLALEYYESSLREPIDNPRQKGQSYLRLGQIYFDSLRQYEVARNYYDSTIQTLPKDYENYNQISDRFEVLDRFVTQINTIHLNDSLLALSELDTSVLRLRFEEIIAAEKEKAKELEEKKRKENIRQSSLLALDNSGISDSKGWYFGNPSAVALGQNEFRRIWGDRPLEDNWRRSNKGSVINFGADQTEILAGVDPAIGETDPTNADVDEESSDADRIASMMESIPFSDEAKEQLLIEIEEALFQLGTIYDFDLGESENSMLTFTSLLERFPDTEHRPEVLYEMYLMAKDLAAYDELIYKNELLNNFPNTTYAKLIANPNYTSESTEANEQQKAIYNNAYELFKDEKYTEANRMLDDALRKYQETVFTPNLKLLKVLITGKTEDINIYQYELSEFIKNNPDAEITAYAETMLEASKEFVERQNRILGTRYVSYFEQEHYFVLIYEANESLAQSLSKEIGELAANYSTEGLSTANLVLDDELAMVLVTGLGHMDDAVNFYQTFGESNIASQTVDSKFHKFVITKDNFGIFYQSKDWEAYLNFFNKHYGNKL